jgi:hypothetical protein
VGEDAPRFEGLTLLGRSRLVPPGGTGIGERCDAKRGAEAFADVTRLLERGHRYSHNRASILDPVALLHDPSRAHASDVTLAVHAEVQDEV